MAWALDRPAGLQWRRIEAVSRGGVRAVVAPLGAGFVGLLAALAGAWGALSVFVGPVFGWQPTSSTAWEWTKQNWLLHLVPGAVGFAAGLVILAYRPRRRLGGRGVGQWMLDLAALLLVAAGTWFVIGPVLWPVFESGTPFRTGVSPKTDFWNQLGSSLGPGLLLAVFGGMALKAGIARPAVAVAEPAEERVVDEPVAAPEGRMATEAMGAAPEGRMAGEPAAAPTEGRMASEPKGAPIEGRMAGEPTAAPTEGRAAEEPVTEPGGAAGAEPATSADEPATTTTAAEPQPTASSGLGRSRSAGSRWFLRR